MRLSVQIAFDKAIDLQTGKTSVIVGRSPDCDLVIPHSGISRKHCKIERNKDQIYITDLGSSNGVFVNNVQLSPNIKSPFGKDDQLKFGALLCKLTVENSLDNEAVNPVEVKTSSNGDVTSTIRMTRLELNEPVRTIELEKKVKPKGPKNPISHGADEVEVEYKSPLKPILMIAGVLAFLAYFFFFSGK